MKSLKSNVSSKRFLRVLQVWLTATLISGLCACANDTAHHGPDMATPLKTGLQRQLVQPDAPRDRTGTTPLPGALAADIYKKRYVSTMTEENNEKEEKASQEFQQ